MPYGMSYGRMQGDPFLGGLIKGAIKLGKGAIGGVIREFTGGSQVRVPSVQLPVPASGMGFPGVGQGRIVPTPGLRGLGQRLIPGGQSGYQVVGQKRRRMNPANPKALRRAIRRQDGFVKLARRALKGSGYQIVSRGSRRPRRDIGAGHTHVR